MSRYVLSTTEKIILLLVVLIVITGFVLFYTSLPSFEWYIREDSLVEWMTVLGLLLGSFICLARFIQLFRARNWWFLTVTLLLGVLLFFAAGEEISWGQRLFGIESSEYFQKNNAQGETNLHNLVYDGVKINKLIFTLGLGIALGIYLLVLPILHSISVAFKKMIDKSGVPVAKLFHLISFALIAGITVLLPHGKNPELLEAGAVLLFFLVIRFPKNLYIFNKSSGL